jgi:ubiquinone/menaquinone biosynthesis C-methylase UbiE
MKNTIYEKIGIRYNDHRTADKRILNAIKCLLHLPLRLNIADIGAGTGNYSNALADLGFTVNAVEPSIEMRNQAIQNNNVIWFDGTAESIPLPDKSVDGVVVILALHHFPSFRNAALEFSRICPNGPIVIFTFDPRECEDFWFKVYFPEIWEQAFNYFPPIHELVQSIAKVGQWSVELHKFLLPNNLSDWFMAVGWNKPELYLNAQIRKSMSGFALADPTMVQSGIQRLKEDLESGIWDSKFGYLRQRKDFDAGYRFVRLKK